MANNWQNVERDPVYAAMFGGAFQNLDAPDVFAQNRKNWRQRYDRNLLSVLQGNRQTVTVLNLPIPTEEAEVEQNIQDLWQAIVTANGNVPPSYVTFTVDNYLDARNRGNQSILYQGIASFRQYNGVRDGIIKSTSQTGRISFSLQGGRRLRGQNIGNITNSLAFLFTDPGPQHDQIVAPDEIVAAFSANWANVARQQGWDNEDSLLVVNERWNVDRRRVQIGQQQSRRAIKSVARPNLVYGNIGSTGNIGNNRYQNVRYDTRTRTFYGVGSPYQDLVNRLNQNNPNGGGNAGGGGGGGGGNPPGPPPGQPPPFNVNQPNANAAIAEGRYLRPRINFTNGAPEPPLNPPGNFDVADLGQVFAQISANGLTIGAGAFYTSANMDWRRQINFVNDMTLNAAGAISFFINQAYDLHIANGGQQGINFIQFNSLLNLQGSGSFFNGGVLYNPITNSGFEGANNNRGVAAVLGDANGVFSFGVVRFDLENFAGVTVTASAGIGRYECNGLIFDRDPFDATWRNWRNADMNQAYTYGDLAERLGTTGEAVALAAGERLIGTAFVPVGQILVGGQNVPTVRVCPPSVLSNMCTRQALLCPYPDTFQEIFAIIRALDSLEARQRYRGAPVGGPVFADDQDIADVAAANAAPIPPDNDDL